MIGFSRMSDFKKIGEIEVEGWGRLSVRIGRYPAGGQIAISLIDADTHHPVAAFSTNLVAHGAEIAPDSFAVKNWSENAPLVKPMLDSGLFQDTDHRIRTGFVEAPVWRMKDRDLVPPIDEVKQRAPRRRRDSADIHSTADIKLTPENLSNAAVLIAEAAQDAEAKGLPGHAQQLTDRSKQVQSWANNLASYVRDGERLPPKVEQYIAAGTNEFLQFAGHPPMNSQPERRSRSRGR